MIAVFLTRPLDWEHCDVHCSSGLNTAPFVFQCISPISTVAKLSPELYDEAFAVCNASKYPHTRTCGFQWAYSWDRTTGNAYGGGKNINY